MIRGLSCYSLEDREQIWARGCDSKKALVL